MWTFYKNGRVVAHEAIGLHGLQHQMRKHGADAAQEEDGDFVRRNYQFACIEGGEG